MSSQTKRAIYAREWRVEGREKRRFNTLLNEYIYVKYKDIYDECLQMYNSLNETYPEKHNLTKTKEYKAWKKRVLATDESTDEAKEPTTMPTRTEPITTATEPTTSTATRTEIAVDGNGDILEMAMEDLLPISPENNNMNVDDIIDNIIRDLQQDEDLRNILDNDGLVQPHYTDEDEGIGLNVESELEAVTEPFDYALEVEGFDF